MNTIEHRVDVVAQAREFILLWRNRYPLCEVPALDLRGGLADRADAPLQLPPERERATHGHEHRDGGAPQARVADQMIQFVLIAHIAANDQRSAVCQR